MFTVEFYNSVDGKEPVADFLDTLDNKMKAKLVSLLELLEENGYFFYVNKTIIVTNGFIKKTQKTPRKEIELAKSRRNDWLTRQRLIRR